MLVSVNRKHDKQYFYKYAKAETAKTILINKTLRFSSPLLFNDPFDVTTRLKLSFKKEELTKNIVEEFVRLVATDASPEASNNPKIGALLQYAKMLDAMQKKEFLESLEKLEIPRNLDELQSFRELEKKWQSLIPQSRMLSLTEEHDNPVMWNTYTDRYTGVVLELECLDIYDSVLLLAEPVFYSDEIPTIGALEYWVKSMTGQVDFDYEKVFRNLELTKTTNWSYEKEWRVISFEKQSMELYSDYGMHPRTFTKIFFGKDIADSDKNDLLGLIAFDLAHLEPYEMTMDYDKRKLAFNRIKKTNLITS